MADVRMGRIAGRLGLAAGALLLTLTAAAGPAVAAPENRAGVFKVSFAGYVSMAEWGTCPDPATEELGTICDDTSLMAFYSTTSEQAGSEVHLRDPWSGTVRLYQSTCVVADLEIDPGVVERTCLSQTERFGRATDADVRSDPRLVATQVTATVPVQVFDFVNDSETTDTVDVVADFRGTGSTRRIDERWHVAGRDGMSLEGTRGWERDCTATASLDGAPVQGELLSCTMLRVHQGEMRVYPNPAGPPARS